MGRTLGRGCETTNSVVSLVHSISRLIVAIQYQLYAFIVRNKTADVRKCRRSADYAGRSERADRGYGRSHRRNGEGRLCLLYGLSEVGAATIRRAAPCTPSPTYRSNIP